jgi:hypothetical protein
VGKDDDGDQKTKTTEEDSSAEKDAEDEDQKTKTTEEDTSAEDEEEDSESAEE